MLLVLHTTTANPGSYRRRLPYTAAEKKYEYQVCVYNSVVTNIRTRAWERWIKVIAGLKQATKIRVYSTGDRSWFGRCRLVSLPRFILRFAESRQRHFSASSTHSRANNTHPVLLAAPIFGKAVGATGKDGPPHQNGNRSSGSSSTVLLSYFSRAHRKDLHGGAMYARGNSIVDSNIDRQYPRSTYCGPGTRYVYGMI